MTPNPRRSFHVTRSAVVAAFVIHYATNANARFCLTHTCIANFGNGRGGIVQCNDGEWSHSGGNPARAHTTAGKDERGEAMNKAAEGTLAVGGAIKGLLLTLAGLGGFGCRAEGRTQCGRSPTWDA